MNAPAILQEEHGDCALACLAMVLRVHGREFDLPVLRSRFSVSPDGVDLVELLAIAGELGFEAKAVRCSVEGLAELPKPAILHWGLSHFVVLSRIRGNCFDVLDPASGRAQLTQIDFEHLFSGIAIILQPTERNRLSDKAPTLGLMQVLLSIPNAPTRLLSLVALALGAQLALFLFPLFIRAILEFAVVPQSEAAALVIFLASCAALLLTSACHYGKELGLERLSRDVNVILASFLNSLLLSRAYSVFQNRSSGTLSRGFGTLRHIRENLSSGSIGAAVDFLAVTLLICLLILINPLIGLGVVGFVLVYALTLMRYSRQRYEPLRRASLLDGRENALLQENIRNMQAIKLNALERTRDVLWQSSYRRASSSNERLAAITSRSALVSDLLLNVGRYGLVAVAAIQFIRGQMSVADFLAVSLYVAFITALLANFVRQLLMLADIQVHLRDVTSLWMADSDPLLDRDAEPDKPIAAPPTTGTDHPALEFEKVSFTFPGAKSELIQDFSLTVERGEVVALYGRSGAGKSTILKLAGGLFRPDEGAIRWFGRDLSEVDRSWLARRMSSVMQEDQLFVGTILQNITGFAAAPDMSRVERACDEAGFSEVIERKPAGIMSQVIPNGDTLSSGEKQRLFLARALFRDTPVLMLDEFTGNLNAELEHRLFENLRHLGSTVLMTAHRDTAISWADRKVLIE